MAWLHHKGRNKHHYEYWQDSFDKGTVHLQMPFKYALELVCDYLAAGQVYSGKSFTLDGELQWWYKKRDAGVAMDSKTKSFVTVMLENMAYEESYFSKQYGSSKARKMAYHWLNKKKAYTVWKECNSENSNE